MKLSQVLIYVGLVLGLWLVVAGFFLVMLYLKDAIFMRVGDADQSLIFWYLPFLFAGLGSVICGIVIGQASWSKLKKNR